MGDRCWEETMGSPPGAHKAVENGGRGKLMARQGSSSHLAAVVHVAGRNDRPPHPIREETNQIQSSLEICLVETIRTVAPGATQLDGVTLVVEISSLPEGFPTTPGPTEPALTTDKSFINADVVMMYRLKERIAKLNEISL